MEYSASNNSNSKNHHCMGYSTPLNEDHIVKTKKDNQDLTGYYNQIRPSSSSSKLSRESPQDIPKISKNLTSSTPAKKSDSFFAMLQDYQPAVLGVIGTDQRSPGPEEFMQEKVVKVIPHSSKQTECNGHQMTTDCSSSLKINRDPKVKNILHRFLAQPKHRSEDNIPGISSLSVLTKNCSINDELTSQSYSATLHRIFMSPEDMEEQQRQRLFVHYDCQSLAANVGYVKNLKKLVNAKTQEDVYNSIVSDNSIECNELLENCPNFRSELGGENERSFRFKKSKTIDPSVPRRTLNSYSVSILESLPNETLWRTGVCPFINDQCTIDAVDHGAHYYRRYFYNQKHENWFGIDEEMGPTAISIKKEKLHEIENDPKSASSQSRYQFRIIIRTSELLTLRGVVLENNILSSRPSGKQVSSKELLEYIAPEIQINCLRLGANSSNCEEQLLKLDEQSLTSKYKVGVLYCRSGQSTEEDMYNNETAGPAFTEFLQILGKRVRLKGFQQYKAGLDNKSDSTGTHSVHAVYKNCEVMFHVSTMLPFTPNNRQQLLRKRHIGNDIVTIVFQEPGALPFSPKNIRSQFQHVFLIVRAINPCTENTTYRVAVSRSKEVPIFGPPISISATFHKNKSFSEFILAKIINAENAAHRSEKFATLAIRTRKEYLKDLCLNYCTNTYIDPGHKFSIFSNKKKEKTKIKFSGDISQRGAISWRVILQDLDFNTTSECFLGISAETLVIIEESSKANIFAAPTRSILGWSTPDNSLRIFYHNGECIQMNMRYFGELDEQQQVIERLRAVKLGNGILELSIKRNMMGQLGFHVQPDGIVTQVEVTGQAWAAGLRQGYRLVEVCKILVATMSYGELIDLLKTSAQLNVLVIKSMPDCSPRSGCLNEHCRVNLLSLENDYEATQFNSYFLENDNVKSILRNDAVPVSTYKSSYEQHSLPNKSKNRSTYYMGNPLSLDSKKSSQASKYYSPNLCNGNWYDVSTNAPNNPAIQSHHNQYKLSSKNEKPSTSPLFLNDDSKVQAWLLNDKLSNCEFSSRNHLSDSHKLLKRHQSAQIELNGNKSSTSSSTKSASGSISKNFNGNICTKIDTNCRCSICNANDFDYYRHSQPSSSNIKCVKRVPSVKNASPMKGTHQIVGNIPRTNQIRPDLLEVTNSNYSSQYDSLYAKIIPKNSGSPKVLENLSAVINDNYKKHGTRKTPETNKDSDHNYSNSKRSSQFYPQITSNEFEEPILRASGSSTHLTDSTQMSTNEFRKNISSTPPLLPYTKELDWTTLVDTATKAIILQLRDDNSCKPI